MCRVGSAYRVSFDLPISLSEKIDEGDFISC